MCVVIVHTKPPILARCAVARALTSNLIENASVTQVTNTFTVERGMQLNLVSSLVICAAHIDATVKFQWSADAGVSLPSPTSTSH